MGNECERCCSNTDADTDLHGLDPQVESQNHGAQQKKQLSTGIRRSGDNHPTRSLGFNTPGALVQMKQSSFL